jgi:hypothetical protein
MYMTVFGLTNFSGRDIFFDPIQGGRLWNLNYMFVYNVWAKIVLGCFPYGL